jgi:hypothetical protein
MLDGDNDLGTIYYNITKWYVKKLTKYHGQITDLNSNLSPWLNVKIKLY